MKRLIFFIILTFLIAGPSLSQVTIKVDTVYSESLHADVIFSVILPQNYDSTRTYPVFYLLHGYTGGHSNWLNLTGLQFYARDWPVIIVMPDAKNSFYMNSASVENDRYEDFIALELPEIVSSKYPVDRSKQGIGGLSMGGYGATILGTLHSDKYIFIGSLSGVIVPWVNNGEESNAYRRLRSSVLSELLGDESHPNHKRYDLFEALEREHTQMPYIFMAHGIQDSYTDFLPGHRAYTDKLRSMDWPYEYHEVPGVHNWTFWDIWVQPMMEAFLKEVAKKH